MQNEDDAVVEEIANLNLEDDSDSDEKNRKVFVGGLSWMTTEDGLQHYFESLGMPVDRVIIMRDKITGRSRGFSFVILRKAEHVDKAVQSNLYFDGRRIEAKRAIPKQDMDNPAKKIFVGGVPVSLSNSEFRKYFEGFGKVLETQVMTDRETGRSRGFGFVTFEDEQIALQVLKLRHQIHGKPVEVKRAEPKKMEAQLPIHIMHPVSLPAMYFPPGFGYPPVYAGPITYDPTYYLASQGAPVAFAPPYFPMEMDHLMYEPFSPPNLRNVNVSMRGVSPPAPSIHLRPPSSPNPNPNPNLNPNPSISSNSSPVSVPSKEPAPHWHLMYPSNTTSVTSPTTNRIVTPPTSELQQRSAEGTFPRSAFPHVRIKPSEVRTERALSASLVPVDFTSDPFNLAESRAEALRKRRGQSQPPVVAKRKTSQPSSKAVGSPRYIVHESSDTASLSSSFPLNSTHDLRRVDINWQTTVSSPHTSPSTAAAVSANSSDPPTTNSVWF